MKYYLEVVHTRNDKFRARIFHNSNLDNDEEIEDASTCGGPNIDGAIEAGKRLAEELNLLPLEVL